MAGRIGGLTFVRKNGKLIPLGESEVTFNLGGVKREAVLSSSGVVGYNAKPQVAFSEGEFIHTKDLDIKDLISTEDATVTHELYNGKTLVLHEAYFAGDGEFTSDGKVKFRFESLLPGELV